MQLSSKGVKGYQASITWSTHRPTDVKQWGGHKNASLYINFNVNRGFYGMLLLRVTSNPKKRIC